MGTIATDLNSIFLHIYFSFLSKIYTFADDFTAITLAICPLRKNQQILVTEVSQVNKYQLACL